MCRWMAYSGGRIPLEDLLFLPKHNLIDQSLLAKSRETPTNGDGFDNMSHPAFEYLRAHATTFDGTR